MSEQGTEPQNQDYLAQHPNAVVDPAKAEFMAYASKNQEEQIVDAGKAALDAASRVGDAGWQEEGTNRTAEHALSEQLKTAEEARVAADQNAETAAQAYDRIAAVTSGKPPMAPQA